MKTRRMSEPRNDESTSTPTCVLAMPLPGVLANLPETDAAEVPQSQGGIYLSAAHPLSNSWPACQKAGIQEGDFFVVLNGETLKQMPARFHFVKGYRSFTKLSKAGDILSRSREEMEGFEEHYTALLILEVNDKLYPSRSDFRGAKVGAIAPAFRALAEATEEKWGNTSDSARIASRFPQPWGRFMVTATTNAQTAKNSGNRYHRGRATTAPSTLSELERLAAAFTDPTFLSDFADAAENYARRVREIAA